MQCKSNYGELMWKIILSFHLPSCNLIISFLHCKRTQAKVKRRMKTDQLTQVMEICMDPNVAELIVKLGKYAKKINDKGC